jgi:hypothetical protein
VVRNSNYADDALFKETDSSPMCGEELWSAELRRDMARQCEMWAKIADKIELNASALGTPRMKLYSQDERDALAAMMANMKQLLGRVSGDLGQSIELTYARLEAALQAYDAFIARAGSSLRD